MRAVHHVYRSEFLKEREAWRQEVKKSKKKGDIVMDPGNDIVCDQCNAEIEEDIIWRDDWGVYCLNCLPKGS